MQLPLLIKDSKLADMFEDFQDEIQKLSQQMISGSIAEQVAAKRRLEEIKGLVGEDDAKFVDELMINTVVDGMTPANKKGLTDQQKSVISSVLTSNTIMGLVGAGAGLAQIISAESKRKGITPPEMPATMTKDPILQDQISKALVRAEEGDPDIAKDFEERLAEQRAVNTERAKTAGNAGQFRSNAQAAGITETRETTKFAADQERRRASARQDLTSLLSLDQQEDRFMQQDEWKRFGVSDSRFRQNLNQLQAQKNSGFQNTFNSLAALTSPQSIMGLNALLQDKSAAGGDELSPLKPDNQPISNIVPDLSALEPGISSKGDFLPNPERNELPPVSLGQVLMMGSRANQTDNNLNMLKQLLGTEDPLKAIDDIGNPNFLDF